jgi:hypothetical protein
MKLFFAKILYYIGDVISETTMVWGNGFGYSVYRQVMLWSCDLDTEGQIWQYVKSKKRKKKK